VYPPHSPQYEPEAIQPDEPPIRLSNRAIGYHDLLEIVPVNVSTSLLKASLDLASWLHSAVYPPSFISRHHTWLESIRAGAPDPSVKSDWIAIYFGILSVSTAFV